MPVIKGSRQFKKQEVPKNHHGEALSKMRCPGCKVGMAVTVLDSGGKRILRCNRCGREYASLGMSS